MRLLGRTEWKHGFVRLLSYSALYLADQAQTLLEGREGVAVMDGCALGSSVNQWPVDVVSRFENLPGWFTTEPAS